jgi:hypothetical protein
MSGFDYDNYAYFVLLGEFVRKGSRGFTGYTDNDGGAHFIWDGRTDHNNNPIPRKFKFSAKERTMRIPINQKDRNGVSVVEFLEGHPSCKRSLNSEEKGMHFFARLSDEADADIAIDAKTRRINAENYVLSLEKEDAMDLVVLFGTFTDKYKLALHKLLEQAGNDPDGFLELIQDSAVTAKVLLKKALAKKVFVKKGGMVKWETEIIGADEESAIQRLYKDKDLSASIQIHVNKK